MSLEDKVMAIIAKNIEQKQELTLDTDLRADLGADSLTLLMIVSAIEDKFGIAVPEEKLPEIKTIRDIVAQLSQIKE